MDTSTIDVVTGVIGSLGFPIFTAVWMMTKGSKETQELKQAVNELTTVVKILVEKEKR